MELLRIRLRINGIVQGVGFRPFVYRTALALELMGFVRNQSDGVLIEIQGESPALTTFQKRLITDLPPLAEISEITTIQIDPIRDDSFQIQMSSGQEKAGTLISPDVATCKDCITELFDPLDRRYRYPFINCTNCGPRFTIVKSIPYDRPNTSMSPFPLCGNCREEYENPLDRRFHAQPNACPECGPQITLIDRNRQPVNSSDWVKSIQASLAEGRIIAIKGIGGFHLAVDPSNEKAVNQLRKRKTRGEKPFALMAENLETIKQYCLVSKSEEQALFSHRRPIVLLETYDRMELAGSIAPGNRFLGFMLPYTPLHSLILSGELKVLVMTSGNLSDEPIAIDNDEAFERLHEIADLFVFHNREILQRCDDSVVRVIDEREQLIRRSRGYVPVPVKLPKAIGLPILACGGELKNSLALSRENWIFPSQHIGDLDNPLANQFFHHCIGLLKQLLEIEPTAIAYDLHPEYLSSKWASGQKSVLKIGVQHHHAHLASVMVENEISDPCLGIILDGTGFGLDSTIWGGEILLGDFEDFERLAWIKPFPLPGGEMAIKQPWRTAISLLTVAYGRDFQDLGLSVVENLNQARFSNLLRMIDRNINSPLTSSCGRMFDGVSAILDIRQEVTFEAQAAIELEMIADRSSDHVYQPVIALIRSLGACDLSSLIRAIVGDVLGSVPVEQISARFHRTLVEVFVTLADLARKQTGINRIGLSGGVYQNAFFSKLMMNRLNGKGFEILTHSKVPTNDGGLALGQIAVANARLGKRFDIRN